MQITYKAPTTAERTVELNESELPALYGAIRDCFLQRLKTFGLADPYLPFEEATIEVCRKVGVDPANRFDVVAFFDGLLIGNGAENSEEVENEHSNN
jgi:hypothetical protein